MATTKKTYSKEFKEEAVRLAKQTGKRWVSPFVVALL
jgi:transposase-like protein